MVGDREIEISLENELAHFNYEKGQTLYSYEINGGARMRDIEKFAKSALEAAVKVGIPKGLGGVADAVEKPEFATAVGLAMLAANDNRYVSVAGRKSKKKKTKSAKKAGILTKILNKF